MKVYFKRIPVVIFLLSFTISFVYITFFYKNKLIYPDTNRYDELGLSLAQGKGYVESDDIVIQSPPVYPLILAGTYYFFGHRHYPVRILQVVLNALSAVLICLIAKIIFNKKIALWAGLISCFYPSFIIFSSLILSENVFIFLILLLVFIWIKALRTQNLKLFVLLGIVLAVATLTRPTALLLILLILFSLVAFKQRRIILKGTILVIIFCLVNFPWVLRNYNRYHVFIPTVLGGGPTLYGGATNCKVWYDEQGKPTESYARFLQIGKGLSSVEREVKYRKYALKIIFEHPFKYIGLFPIKLWQLYVRPAGYEQLGGLREGIFKKFCFLVVYSLILFYSLIGIVRIIKNRNKEGLICLSIIVYFVLMHILLVSEPRHQFSSMPFIIILAAYGLSRDKIWNKIRIDNSKQSLWFYPKNT